jgi:hypothetical protein
MSDQHLVGVAAFTTLMITAARPLVCRFGSLAVLLLLVGISPLRRHALPGSRFGSPSAEPNCGF